MKAEKVSEICRLLIRERIVRYAISLTIVSDNGPPLVAEITQKLDQQLKIRWNLHTALSSKALAK